MNSLIKPLLIFSFLISVFYIQAQSFKNDTLIFVSNDSSCFLSIPKKFIPNHQEPSTYWVCRKEKYELASFQITIYDHWGTKVYQTDSPNKPWDGKLNKVLVSSGQYTWIIHLTIPTSSKFSKKNKFLFKGNTEIYY